MPVGMPVRVDNDVNCHALAEARRGAGRPYRHFLLAAVGTGVGGGVVIDGQVYPAAGWPAGAGEIGQLVRGSPRRLARAAASCAAAWRFTPPPASW